MIKNKWNNHKLAAESMAFLMVCLFLLFSLESVMSYAKDSFLAGYMQSVYNQKSGIGSNEVNCLFQSSSGYMGRNRWRTLSFQWFRISEH